MYVKGEWVRCRKSYFDDMYEGEWYEVDRSFDVSGVPFTKLYGVKRAVQDGTLTYAQPGYVFTSLVTYTQWEKKERGEGA